MAHVGGPYDFVYVHTDIPEGMTIREWRAQRAADHAAARERQRAARRTRRRARWRRSIVGLARAIGAAVALGAASARAPRRVLG